MFIDPSVFTGVTRRIIGAAIEVHRHLGPGLLESIYDQCLQMELASSKMRYVAQRQVPLAYKGIPLNAFHRVDLIVEDLVVVEVKAVTAIAPVHSAQVLTYLHISERPAGLLITFNVPLLVDGVKRLINPRVVRAFEEKDWDEPSSAREGSANA